MLIIINNNLIKESKEKLQKEIRKRLDLREKHIMIDDFEFMWISFEKLLKFVGYLRKLIRRTSTMMR